jgi:hypothetical protein
MVSSRDRGQNGAVSGKLYLSEQAHRENAKTKLYFTLDGNYPEYEAPHGTHEDGSKYEGSGNNPTFSLAGPGANNPASNAYVGDQYREYNPQYGKEN